MSAFPLAMLSCDDSPFPVDLKNRLFDSNALPTKGSLTLFPSLEDVQDERISARKKKYCMDLIMLSVVIELIENYAIIV